MSIYRIDSSCYIESRVPRKAAPGEPLCYRSDGSYLGDEFFISRFDDIERAIKKGEHDNLKEQVKKLGDVNAECKYTGCALPSYTLLHEAVKKGCVVCTQILLECGAKPDIKNSAGITAEMAAREKNDPAVIELIEKSKPTSQVISEQTKQCTLTRKHGRAMDKKLFGDMRIETFEGTLVFGPTYQDRANVMLSRSVNVDTYENYEINVPITVQEMKYEGKQAFKITYNKQLYTIYLTPNLEKYLIGKNDTFIKKEETQVSDPDFDSNQCKTS